MPLTAKGNEILSNLEKEYGAEKGKQVLYAGKNKGTFTGIDSVDRRASAAADRADKPPRPTPPEQKRRAARLVRKARLELGQRSRPGHRMPPRARRRSPARGTLILHIDQPGTAG